MATDATGMMYVFTKRPTFAQADGRWRGPLDAPGIPMGLAPVKPDGPSGSLVDIEAIEQSLAQPPTDVPDPTPITGSPVIAPRPLTQGDRLLMLTQVVRELIVDQHSHGSIDKQFGQQLLDRLKLLD